MLKSTMQFVNQHYRQDDGLRLGQRFHNLYLKENYMYKGKDLFYMEDGEAIEAIDNWLYHHQYSNELPKEQIVELNEKVLEDDYPVYCSYVYVCDGEILTSHITGTVKDLKDAYDVKEVKSCDIYGRLELEDDNEQR